MINKKVRLLIAVIVLALALYSFANALRSVFNAQRYNDLGFAALKNNEPSTAKHYFMKAVIVDPRWAISYNNLGVAFQRTGDSTRAMAMFAKAYSMDPALIEPRLNLGDLYIEEGRFEDAVNVLKGNLIRDAYHPQTLFELARAYLLNKNPEQAAVYAQLLLDHSEDPALLTSMGSLFAQQGFTNAAFPCFIKAQKVDNFYTDVYVELGKLYGNLNLFPQAISVWQDGLLVAPNDERFKDYIKQALRLMEERKQKSKH